MIKQIFKRSTTTFHYSKKPMFSGLKISDEEVDQVLNVKNSFDSRKKKLNSILNAHANEILKFEKELRQVAIEKNLVETKLQDVIRQLKQDLLKQRNEIETLTMDYLKSMGKLNVKGALEYCAEKILSLKTDNNSEEPLKKKFRNIEKKIQIK
jgi:hypothetical protein